MRQKQEILSEEDEKIYNMSWLDVETFCQILGRVCSLYRHQGSRTMPPDHAVLCSQEIRKSAEGNGPCQVLLGMIRSSA